MQISLPKEKQLKMQVYELEMKVKTKNIAHVSTICTIVQEC
jgi:hypothetical protein